MSGRRNSAQALRKSATPHSNDDIDMESNSAHGIESDAEGEMVIDGRDDLYEIIDRLSTLLCAVSEE